MGRDLQQTGIFQGSLPASSQQSLCGSLYSCITKSSTDPSVCLQKDRGGAISARGWGRRASQWQRAAKGTAEFRGFTGLLPPEAIGWTKNQLQILTPGHCFKALKPDQAEQKFIFWLCTAGIQPRKDKFWNVTIPLYMSVTAWLPVSWNACLSSGVPAALAVALSLATPWQIVEVLLAPSSTKPAVDFCFTYGFSQSTTADAQKAKGYCSMQRDWAVWESCLDIYKSAEQNHLPALHSVS